MTNTPLRPARSALTEVEPPPRRRRRWPWIVGAVVAVVAAGGAAFALSRDEPPPPEAPRAFEGVFQLTVDGSRCGFDSVGPQELPQHAQGQFCLVDVTVRNTGAESQLLDPGAQRAIDNGGGEHRVAEQALVFLNERQPTLLDEIPPGAAVKGVLPFDVPAGSGLSELVLHSSMDSPGARVPVT
ncbi:DUF4352 domain-containing protein [Paractinoplanes deccanensis]|uniref:DUF4352 domain-containing protein n=1 Tax=Paractinoplanes deccanensis TaxID=113561 RepID=UPI001EF32F2F|nr:DUF4352 domain-containing protein [Actinoplanes deccanensis]